MSLASGRPRPRPVSMYSSSDECHCCHAHGAFGYRADEPGKLLWFCDGHKPAKHFADARRGGTY
jgi:hypothetical protein